MAHAQDAREYRLRHLEQQRAYDRLYYAANRDAMNARDRERYQQPARKAATKAAAQKSYQANRGIRIAAASARNRANPEGRRRIHLKRMYGITPEDYDRLHAAQNGRCGICTEPAQLVVDHDHETGRVRGLLCRKCNAAIGGLHDSPDLLRRALVWLEDN